MSVLIAAFPAVNEIGKRVARELKAEYTEIKSRNFPDNEFHLKLQKNPKNNTVVIINSITKDPDEKLIETILAGGVAKDYRAKKVILVATYLPYLRQDRHFLRYDSFSAKHILKLLNQFDKILVVDPHLHRIHKMNQLSRKADNITVNSVVAQYIKKRFKNDFTIVGPDAESFQWSKNIAEILGKKVVILKKTRLGDRKIKQKEREFGSKNIIIIDDIISTGRTILGVVEMAKKQGAKKIVCIGIHGVLCDGADKLITKHAELITTNSIPGKYGKIDISEAIIEKLRRYR